MNNAKFLEVNPVLPVKNVSQAIEYYVNKLGFRLRFTDTPNEPRYAGIERGGVRLHLQWHDASEFEEAGDVASRRVDTVSLRFVIDDADILFEEYKDKDVFHSRTDILDTAWGTREFAFYDLDGNGLFFYHNL